MTVEPELEWRQTGGHKTSLGTRRRARGSSDGAGIKVNSFGVGRTARMCAGVKDRESAGLVT